MYDAAVSVPVTARLDESVVDALDKAVEAGLAPNRGAVVAAAVKLWLTTHSESEIEASYRRRYTETDPEADVLVERLAAFSVAACLADTEH